MASKLIPPVCPWCRKAPKMVEHFAGGGWKVSCTRLSCPVQPATHYYRSRRRAILAWSRGLEPLKRKPGE